jgi:hypothetical protein
MAQRLRFHFPHFLVALAALVLIATPAFAGPPLLCFPFEIGTARSLPMGTQNWQATDRSYNASHLVADTIALLAPETPVIVRMETLRRATVYASKHPELASPLLDALEARAAKADPKAGYVVFDFGYLAETYKQASWMPGDSAPAAAMHTAIARAKGIDGYMLVQKAQTLTGDKSMAFALVAMSVDKTRGVEALQAHVAEAREAAKTDASVRANLATHWTETTTPIH